MAHTTIINGTIYEKSKGKDLAGGTVYEKDHGKTLVGGTVYEVGFAKPTVKVLLANDTTSYFKVGELSSAGIYELSVGETLIFDVGGDDAGASYIYLNSTTVAGGSGVKKCSYEHTLTADTAIQFGVSWGLHSCRIREAAEGDIVFVIDYAMTGGSYTAKDGMTWAEWYNSDYSSSKAAMTISDDSVKLSSQTIKYNNIAVKPTDKLIGFAVYTV